MLHFLKRSIFNPNKLFQTTNIIRKFSSLYVWGSNKNNCLGISTPKQIPIPTKINLPKSIKTIKNVSFGPNHTAITADNGLVYTCGLNKNFVLGRSENYAEVQSEFKVVEGLKNVKMTVCGDNHTLALKENGEVFLWGESAGWRSLFNTFHLSKKIVNSQPKRVNFSEKIKSISAGDYHSLALTNSGKVFSWGYNNTGVLGGILMEDCKIFRRCVLPKEIEFFTNKEVIEIKTIGRVNVAITKNNNAFLWGLNNNGQLGFWGPNLDANSCQFIPTKLMDSVNKKPFNVDQMNVCSNRIVLLTPDQKIYAWGKNCFNPNIRLTTPKVRKKPIRFKDVKVGKKFFAGLSESGEVFVWGNDKTICRLSLDSFEMEQVETLKGKKVSEIFCNDDKIAAIVQ